MGRADWARIRGALASIDIFSLNLTEARELLEVSDAYELLRQLVGAMSGIVVLRMGRRRCFDCRPERGNTGAAATFPCDGRYRRG